MKSAKTKSLQDVFEDQLKDIYDAEKQLVKALPKVVKAATCPSLQEAVKMHLEETKGHVARLEEIFEAIGIPAKGKTCDAMKGLLKEADAAIEEYPKGYARDAALIAGAQRVEHYEMAAYGSMRAFAEELGHDEAASLLQETLDEEKAADEKLNETALNEVNPEAAGESDEEDEGEEAKPKAKH